MARRLKAIHVSTVRTPFEARVFHHECVALQQAGHRVELAVHCGETDSIVEGIQIRTLGPKRKAKRGLLIWSRLQAVLQAAKKIRESDAHIVHLHDPELIPLGCWLKLTRPVRVIYDSAENYTAYMSQKYYIAKPIRWLLTYLMAATETIAAQFFDAVITADSGTTAIFADRGAKRLITLHNFPLLSLFDNKSVDESQKEYDLVYHGSIPKYHLETAFEVASELKRRGRRVRWLFFGVCNDVPWANTTIAERGLQDDFEIQGRTEHDRVADLVARARIGFIPLPDLPKFQQNIPMKLFEFMALRMPAVLSDLPPSRPFVGDGKAATMVPPGNINAYADAIECLLESDELRQQMGIVGRQRVEQEYNWETESRKLLQLYEELADASKELDLKPKTSEIPAPSVARPFHLPAAEQSPTGD